MRRRAGPADHAHDELLRPNANPILIGERHDALRGLATDLDAVSRAEILDRDVVSIDDDASVLARNERVVDGNLAGGAASDDGDAGTQVNLLEQESKAVTGHAMARGGARLAHATFRD